jgi:NADH-quinone oxidoreductase subunit N
MTYSDLITVLPLIFLTVWACVILLVDLFIPKDRKGWTALLAAVGLAAALGMTILYAGQAGFAFSRMVVLDGFASFLDVLFLATGLLGIALAYGYLRRMGLERGEYYALLLFSVTGMILMAQAANLIVKIGRAHV